MQVMLLPFIIIIVLAALGLVAWSVVRVIKRVRQGKPVSPMQVLALVGLLIILSASWCLFFIIRASLGHSAHPFVDAFPECLWGTLVILVLPTACLYFFVRKQERKSR